MKKNFIITYDVVNGGGSKNISLDLPADACNIKIEPVDNNVGATYIGLNGGDTVNVGGCGGRTIVNFIEL